MAKPNEHGFFICVDCDKIVTHGSTRCKSCAARRAFRLGTRVQAKRPVGIRFNGAPVIPLTAEEKERARRAFLRANAVRLLRQLSSLVADAKRQSPYSHRIKPEIVLKCRHLREEVDFIPPKKISLRKSGGVTSECTVAERKAAMADELLNNAIAAWDLLQLQQIRNDEYRCDQPRLEELRRRVVAAEDAVRIRERRTAGDDEGDAACRGVNEF